MTKFNTFATFLIEQDLFEDKVDVILSKQGDKLFSAYEQDKGADKPKCKDAKEVIDHLSEISKEYLQWLVTRYIAGQFYLEDKSKLEWVTQNFKKVAKKLEFNDINKYKDVANLETEMRALDPESQKSNKRINKEEASALEAEFIKKKKAIIYYDEGPIKVVIPKSVEASQYFGKGTRWCTAAENNNMFKSYSRGKDVLYIINLRGNKNKYQIHFKTQQFMDTEDHPVSDETLSELCKKYPMLTEIFTAQAKEVNWPLLLMGDKTEDEIIDIITQDNARYLRTCDNVLTAIQYLIDTKRLSSECREKLVGSTNLLSTLYASSSTGFMSKAFKDVALNLLKTDDDKIEALALSGLKSTLGVDGFLKLANVLGLTTNSEFLVKLFDAMTKEKKWISTYKAAELVNDFFDKIDLPKELPPALVKSILKLNPEIYKSEDFGPKNFNRMFPNLPEADKASGVVFWAKRINNEKNNEFDLIPAKWKSRTNWKPAVKI